MVNSKTLAKKLSEVLDKREYSYLVSLIRMYENDCTDSTFSNEIQYNFDKLYPEVNEAFNACEKAGLGYPEV